MHVCTYGRVAPAGPRQGASAAIARQFTGRRAAGVYRR
ncbi:hypothetical protein AX27061_2796 [Achromobacter xylosoxidans NBRC 15126 = ATCC 27061]|nr:hypothetical protein AX27061_2796 [Achromobacter xylosoxidans NBRC 15126 = ATCC 27061]